MLTCATFLFKKKDINLYQKLGFYTPNYFELGVKTGKFCKGKLAIACKQLCLLRIVPLHLGITASCHQLESLPDSSSSLQCRWKHLLCFEICVNENVVNCLKDV